MTESITAILGVIKDPAVSAVVLGSAAVLYAQHRLYGKHHAFLSEERDLLNKRLDRLQAENLEFETRTKSLRAELERFETENRRLKSVAETIIHLSQSLQATSELADHRQHQFIDALRSLSDVQQRGFYELADTIRQNPSNTELLALLDELVSAVVGVERDRSTRLTQVHDEIRRMLPSGISRKQSNDH